MNSFAISEHVRFPNRITTSAGYAFFPGTGPSGLTCNGCAFAAKIGTHTTCRKWQDQKRSVKPGPAIDRNSPSCKYFVAKGTQS
jgi:hypothetical protein